MTFPPLLKPRFATMPLYMRRQKRWVLWRAEWNAEKQKWNKPPVQPNGYAASSTDPQTWSTFEEVRAAYEANPGAYGGVGFVLTGDDNLCVVDLDHAYDDGKTLPVQPTGIDAQAFIDSIPTYCERSVSGGGFHILGFAELPKGGRKKADTEMYENGRYITVSGHLWPGAVETIEPCQEQIDAAHKLVWPPQAPRPGVSGATVGTGLLGTDADLLEKAYASRNGDKIKALYDGSTTGYPGHSEADLALCSLLAFWTGPDEARLDGIFQQSGLMRDKWGDRHFASGETYGEHTIRLAIASCTEFYKPPSARKNERAGKGGKTNATPENETGAAGGSDAAQEEGGGRGPSIATRLVHLTRERFDLWHTNEMAPYASVSVGTHTETWAVESTGMRDHLRTIYIEETGNVLPPAALQSALDTIATFARKGPTQKIYTRKADLGHTIYIDPCNDKWQCWEITKSGWRVLDRPPAGVAFRRTKGMDTLPVPVPGGSIGELRQFINAPATAENDDLFVLIVAWILCALGPHHSYPILQLMGEQGTAKSSSARFLRRLFDPATPPLMREPKEDRDFAIAAKNRFCVGYDNLSGIQPWLSDTFCTASTGGGFHTRKLHSDDDEMLFDFLCPVLLTSIGEASTRPDFLQRTILLTLPVISDEQRREEADLLPAFEEALPRILGALLDAVSCGLRNIASVRLPKLPRMADFARWSVACEPACPWPTGAFLEAYGDNQATGSDTALESDRIAPLLVRLIEGQQYTPGYWEGGAADLLDALKKDVSDQEKNKLPANARALGVALRRIGPALRQQRGIEMVGPVKDRKGVRVYKITKSERATAQTTAQTTAQKSTSDFAPSPAASRNTEETAQDGMTAQKSPPSNSPHISSKKEEKEEDAEATTAKTGDAYNASGFAPFMPSRRHNAFSPVSASDDEPEDPFADDTAFSSRTVSVRGENQIEVTLRGDGWTETGTGHTFDDAVNDLRELIASPSDHEDMAPLKLAALDDALAMRARHALETEEDGPG